MKKVIPQITLSLALIAAAANASAEQPLTGDVKLACEALLCLSSTTQPQECNPALEKFFSIKRFRASSTRSDRRKFLSLCPVEQTQAHQDLIQSLVK
jgi:hypothetical protein